MLGDHVLTRCWSEAPVVAAPGWVAALAVGAATADPSAVRADTRENSSREGRGRRRVRGRHVGSIIVDLHLISTLHRISYLIYDLIRGGNGAEREASPCLGDWPLSSYAAPIIGGVALSGGSVAVTGFAAVIIRLATWPGRSPRWTRTGSTPSSGCLQVLLHVRERLLAVTRLDRGCDAAAAQFPGWPDDVD
jgi:hypothetical protein